MYASKRNRSSKIRWSVEPRERKNLTLRNSLGLGWVRIFQIYKIPLNVIYYLMLACTLSLFPSNSSKNVNVHRAWLQVAKKNQLWIISTRKEIIRRMLLPELKTPGLQKDGNQDSSRNTCSKNQWTVLKVTAIRMNNLNLFLSWLLAGGSHSSKRASD